MEFCCRCAVVLEEQGEFREGAGDVEDEQGDEEADALEREDGEEGDDGDDHAELEDDEGHGYL